MSRRLAEPLTAPDRFGARASKLTKLLDDGHYDAKLSDDEWERIVTWMDANALFYGTFNPEQQARQLRGERIAGPIRRLIRRCAQLKIHSSLLTRCGGVAASHGRWCVGARATLNLVPDPSAAAAGLQRRQGVDVRVVHHCNQQILHVGLAEHSVVVDR